MQVDDSNAPHAFHAQSRDADVLTPEVRGAQKVEEASTRNSVQERVWVDDALEKASFGWNMTEALSPEIIKAGGLEAAILLLMQERTDMFESNLTTKINRSRQNQDRLLQQSKERLEDMREALKEMDKAKKSGKISQIFGWVGLGAATVATFLTAGAMSPMVLAASVGVLGVTTGLQVDGATGGHVMQGMSKAVGLDSEKGQMAFSIGLGVALMATSIGIATYAAFAASGSRGAAAAASGAAAGGKGGAGAAGGATGRGGQGLSNVAQASRGGSGAGLASHKGSRTIGEFFSKRNPLLGDPKAVSTSMDTGDHWLQQASSLSSASLQSASQITQMRSAYSRFEADKMNVESLKMRAIERRLSTHMDYLAQVIEDILGSIQNGNRTLAKQLAIAFEPKEAILANV